MLATAWTMDAAPSFATCLVSKDPAIRELQTLVDKDAARALKQVAARLRPLEQAPQLDAQLLASLYAVQAQAYSMLELDEDARGAASKGLQFATRIGDPVRLDLLSAHAENVYDAAGMDAALKTIDEARASQAAGSLADTCLLITRGVPGTHDVPLAQFTLDALRNASAKTLARIPRFDKGTDTRLPPSRWR